MRRRFSARMKWVLGAALGLVLALAGATAAYAAHYSDHALPGVTVAGTSVTGQTRAEVAAAVAQRATDITVTVNVDGSATTAKLADLGITVDADATAERAFASNASVLSRLGALFTPTNVAVVSTTDDAALGAFEQEVAAAAGDSARDATVTLSSDKTSFVVTPAVSGRGIDTDALATVTAKAVSTLTSQSADLTSTETTPTVTTADAQAVADKANALVALDVTISDGVDTFSATPAQKASWVDVPTSAQGLGTPDFDDAAVKAWVARTAKDTNVEAVKGVQNVNSSGKVVATVSQGSSGWSVNNEAAVADAVVKALSSGTSYSGSFNYDETKPTFEKRQVADGSEKLVYQAAVGEKWVDVNLSNYTVTAYEGATKVYGPVYMVPGAPETPTVTGTYHVYLKYASQTMRGRNTDGTTYVTPDVPWVTYFYESYALHGAPWRSSFGWGGPGGSHGCVNMPVDGAKWFYDWTEMGTTVVSHR